MVDDWLVDYTTEYTGDYDYNTIIHNPVEGSRIQWKERGILNTANISSAIMEIDHGYPTIEVFELSDIFNWILGFV